MRMSVRVKLPREVDSIPAVRRMLRRALTILRVDAGSERGRGLFLIKALSENVRMHSAPRGGSLIHFEKSFA